MKMRGRGRGKVLWMAVGLTVAALGAMAGAAGLGSVYVDRHGVVHRVGPIIPHSPNVAYNPNSGGFYETVPDPQGYHCYDAGAVHGCYFTYGPDYTAPDLVWDQEAVADECVPAYLDDLYGPVIDYAFSDRCPDIYSVYGNGYGPDGRRDYGSVYVQQYGHSIGYQR